MIKRIVSENNKDRYKKLESVGCWFDTRSHFTFPMNVDGSFVKDIGMACHIDEISDEFRDQLDDYDYNQIILITGTLV